MIRSYCHYLLYLLDYPPGSPTNVLILDRLMGTDVQILFITTLSKSISFTTIYRPTDGRTIVSTDKLVGIITVILACRCIICC